MEPKDFDMKQEQAQHSDARDDLNRSFTQLFRSMEDIFGRNEKDMIKALSIQKKKFLIAVNKSNDEYFSEEDEKLVKNVLHAPKLLIRFNSRPNSVQWDDTKASRQVESILNKHAVFQISKYLDCAKIVFLAYSGIYSVKTHEAMEYVLTHARQFGDPAKTIFQSSDMSTANQEIDLDTSTIAQQTPLPNSPFMNRVSQLIDALRLSYDEINYRSLNVNATYFVLLMLRRIVKNEVEFSAAFKRIHTHDSYVKLCPSPLGNQLPKCDTRGIVAVRLTGCAHLALEAYLNAGDERTRRGLQTTCVLYIEWNGLQLYHLFFEVVDLYNVEAGNLWNCLAYNGTEVALMKLAKNYYDQYKVLKEDPMKTQRWFPYCRVLDGNYHQDLSATDDSNSRLCIILAYLVDMKIGFDKSTITNAYWVKKSSIPVRESSKQIAENVYKKING